MPKAPVVPEGLPRREFLKIGTFSILAGALTPSVFARPLESRNPGGDPLLSIGYSENVPVTGEAVRLQSALGILAGDPTFISRGARLRFDSFSRPEKYRDRLAGGAAIDVVYPAHSYTPERLPRFRAWSFKGREDGDTASGPIAFNVPVSATDGVTMVVRRMQTEAAETAENAPRGFAADGESSAGLALGFGSKSAKLARGVYVIAFRETVDDVMTDWSLFRLAKRSTDFVVTPASFTYVVMTVDYAS
jgi:hypothetical protein